MTADRDTLTRQLAEALDQHWQCQFAGPNGWRWKTAEAYREGLEAALLPVVAEIVADARAEIVDRVESVAAGIGRLAAVLDEDDEDQASDAALLRSVQADITAAIREGRQP